MLVPVVTGQDWGEEKLRRTTIAAAFLSVTIAAMFLVPGVGTVIAQSSASGNDLHVIVMVNGGARLNDVAREMKDLGATNVKKLQLINAVSGTISLYAYQQLESMSSVVQIAQDQMRQLDPVPSSEQGGSTLPPGKPYAVDPYVEPEAISVTHALEAQALGYTGEGIKVGFVDSGVDYKNPDLAPAIAAYVDTTGTGLKDEDGHGTGTASMVGAQGYYVFNSLIDQYMQVKGMAPGAKIYEAKVFDKTVGWDSNIIAGIQWAVDNHVDILSCSVGTYDMLSNGIDPVALAMTAAANAGVTVFVAAGNEGPGQGTVETPAVAHGVISVGSSTYYREFSQEGFLMPVGGAWTNSQVIDWSSRPPTSDGRMNPDIMSPGAFGWALAPTYYLAYSGARLVQEFGGTSQATPVAAGCTALLMSAYEQMHPGAALPGPAYWESLIRSTATNLGYPGFDQSSGLINVTAALNALDESTPAFLLDNNEWSVTAGPGANLPVTISGLGPATQTITVQSTEFVPMEDKTLQFDDIMTRANGYSANHMMSIPQGTNLIKVSTVWSQGGPFVSFRNAVYDSSGAFVTYGPTYGGYGHLALSTVSLNGPDPPALGGMWNVTIFPRGGMAPTSDTFVKTHVEFFKEMPGGWVDSSASSVTVSPGGTATFTLSLNGMTPTDAGTYFGQVRVSNGFGQVATIPVVLAVPLTMKGTTASFQGTFTGSTVEYVGGEFYYFQLEVPQDTANIFATVSWDHEGNLVWIWLVSPEGKMVDINGAGNDISGYTNTGGLGHFDTSATGEQLVWTDPEPGTWRMGVFAAGFWGGGFSERFTGKVMLNENIANPERLDFAGLHVGENSTQQLTVSNLDGVAPMEVFGIATSDSVLTYTNMTAKGTLSVSHNGAEDYYMVLVKPNTKSIEFDLSWAPGSPQLSLNAFDPTFSASGSTVSPAYGEQGDGFASMAITDPMPGIWIIFVDYYGHGGFSPVTYMFKTSSLASAECTWLSVSATPQTPVTVMPGSTVTLSVTATASAAMSGTVHADLLVGTTSGDRLATVTVTMEIV